MLAYDTDMEEIASSRDRHETMRAADAVVHAHSVRSGAAYEDVFRIGQRFHDVDCFYFAWAKDKTTLLFFKGPRPEALKRLRRVPPMTELEMNVSS